MKDPKSNLQFISDDQRRKSIQEIQTFFAEERDEEIGVIAAEEILDFFLEGIGKGIYNSGVENARKFVKEHCDDMTYTLGDLLRK
ncbi:MAG: DUF2164 domain-containing protein [Candidatus Magasanikbacteria bacterium]